MSRKVLKTILGQIHSECGYDFHRYDKTPYEACVGMSIWVPFPRNSYKLNIVLRDATCGSLRFIG